MIDKFIEITNKWRRKYNTLCIKYAALADKQINVLEEDRKILLDCINYKKEIEDLKSEISKYKRKYGKLKGCDKNVKSKSE